MGAMLQYGQHITTKAYKNGKVVTVLDRTIESIPITSQKQLWDVILEQLGKSDDCTEFKIFRDKHSRQIYRMEVTNESKA